jgi:hypothetical protein
MPKVLYILNPLAAAAIFSITTLMIIHMQLKNKSLVSIWTGPPFIATGIRLLMNHGSPKHNSMSRVFAPKALLMLIDPSPVPTTRDVKN